MKTLNGYEVYDDACREQITGVTTAGTGAAYTATVKGISSLTAGVSFTMIPHTVSTSTSPTLNVNSLGAKNVRQRLSSSTGSTVVGETSGWIASGKPIKVIYDGTYWIVDTAMPDANYLYGTVPVASGGTGATTANAALNNLGISWGTTAASSTGTPNSIYIQII